MAFMDKKQLNNRRSSVRNTLKAERERALSNQRGHAIDLLNRRRIAAESREDRSTGVQRALLFGTADLAHKVLGAFNVSTPVHVSELSRYSDVEFRAYTDFRTINVLAKTEGVNVTDFDDVARYVFTVKGAVYHEGGHILYTLPFNQMIERLREEGKTAEIRNQMEDILINDHHTRMMLQRCWNIIEDQRMEMAMVTVSPVLSNYFTSTVLNVVINRNDIGGSWPYVTGRLYLPYEMRKRMRKEAKKHKNADLVPLIDSAVARYRVARTLPDMFDALWDFYQYMKEWGLGTASQESQHQSYRRSESPEQLPSMDGNTGYEDDDDDEDDEDEGDEQSSGGQGDDESNDEGDGQSQSGGEGAEDKEAPQPSAGQGISNDNASNNNDNSDSNNNDSKGRSSDRSNAGGGSGAGRGQGDLNDMIEKTLESLKPSITSEVKSFVTKVNEELGHDLNRDPTAKAMKPEDVAESMGVKVGILGALEHLIDQTNPTWQFRQESGVLDPTAYVMREPGDTDYWSGLDGMGNRGYDLSVSVVLDTSYSMENHTDKLSVAALGIRLACDELDIPCDVSTFNSIEGAVYRADEPTVPYTVRANGGTEPGNLMSMLDSQRHDKKRHLVLILTDGEWSDCPSLAPFGSPGRYFLLLGFGVWDSGMLKRKNPNAYAVINDLMEMPAQFTKSLAGFMA